MSTSVINPKQFLQVTRIIYFALIAGQLFFLAAVLFITGGKFIFKINLSDPLLLCCILLTCVSPLSGYLIAKMMFKQIDQNDQLMNKLTKYQSGQIIRLATCEGIGLLAIVSLLLTDNSLFFVFLLIIFALFWQYYPSPEFIGRDLNLTETEINSFVG